MDECCNCKLWDDSQYIMNYYGDGYGRCGADGQITFCSHKCPFCDQKEEEYDRI